MHFRRPVCCVTNVLSVNQSSVSQQRKDQPRSGNDKKLLQLLSTN